MCFLFRTYVIVLIFMYIAGHIQAIDIRNYLQFLGLRPAHCYIPPKICPNENVTFYLYTSENPTTPFEMSVNNPESIRNAKLKQGPIKFLIHGYTAHKDYSPNMEIRPVYLRKSADINVISLDYAPLVRKGCYLEAVENSKLVANCTAQFLEQLLKIRSDVQLSQIHMIGLSLGAQVAGQIATYFSMGQIERISALDAAAPLFYSTFTPDYKEINKGDAKFIDALHTNAGIQGKLFPYADVDFYANGGTHQPGCSLLNTTCSHELSAKLFAESINSPGGFRAFSRSFYTAYFTGWSEGSGNDSWEQFGEYVNPKARGVYFFKTNNKEPYAKY